MICQSDELTVSVGNHIHGSSPKYPNERLFRKEDADGKRRDCRESVFEG